MIPLISIGDLITNGLKDIQQTWKSTLRYTVWFFIAPMLFSVVMLAVVFGAGLSDQEPGPGVGLLFGIGYLALIVGLVWATIALMRYLIEHVQGHIMSKWKPKESALAYLPRLLWVSILAGLPILAAWIVASLPLLLARDSDVAGVLMAVFFLAAFVFTIWITVAFSQSYLLVLTDEARGVEALKRSYAMVLGRWWKTLWRFFVPNLVFQIILGMIMGLFYMIVFMLGFALFGGWMASLGIGEEAARASNVGFGLLGVLLGIALALVGLLLVVAQVIAQAIYQASVSARLFFSLKQTNNE